MRTQRLVFVYVLVTTVALAIAWAATNGPWTEGETIVGVMLLLTMMVVGWNRK